MEKNQRGCIGETPGWWGDLGPWPPSPLNPALLRSGVGQKVKRAERSGERLSRVQKIKWSARGAGAGGRRSGNGAVSGTPVNGAERWAGNLAGRSAPLTCCAPRSLLH